MEKLEEMNKLFELLEDGHTKWLSRMIEAQPSRTPGESIVLGKLRPRSTRIRLLVQGPAAHANHAAACGTQDFTSLVQRTVAKFTGTKNTIRFYEVGYGSLEPRWSKSTNDAA